MRKISLIALVGLFVILACGCVSASEPTSMEIVTNNSSIFDESSGRSIEEVYVVLYDSNGNSVSANGAFECIVGKVPKDGSSSGVILNTTVMKLDKNDFVHTQYDTFELDSNKYVRSVTKDVYLVHACNILHMTDFHGDFNRYDICNYVRTKEGGFKPEEFDVITDLDAVYPVEQLNMTNSNGCSLYKNLMVIAYFHPDGSDSTISAEKVLTA